MPAFVLAALAVTFLCVWAGRYFYFRGRRNRSIALFDLYKAYIFTKGDGPPDRDALTRRTHEVHELWRGANMQDGGIAYTNPVGWGYVASGHYSPMENWTTLNQDVAAWVWQAFNRTIGHYDDRAREARNPVYTVLGILTLPQSTVRWLGVGSGRGTPSKVASLVWSGFLAVAVVLGFVVTLRELGVSI
jgi:hypothetical protein